MVKFKPVLSLSECVKKEIPKIVKNHIIRSAYNLHISWYVICAGYSHLTTQEVLNIQMERFRKYLQENIIWTDRQEIFYLILRGVDEGIMKVRRGWTKEKKHEQYMQVMEAVTMFTDLAQFPNLHTLDFAEVPRTIRFRLFQMIPRFTQLKILIIGPGTSGAWIPIKGKSAVELSSHLSHLPQLTHFSLKKDCNIKILESLVSSCSTQLQTLDVENSNYLQDEAVALICQCKSISTLNISGTNISDEGKARIVMSLRCLRHLVRADYLCDVLGWIDYLEEMEDPVFDIREFIPSTTYFFHESWQLEMLSRMCPRLEKMFFIQHHKCCPSLQPLEQFHHLAELQIHGSHWGRGGLEQLLEKIGHRLQCLGLIAVKDLSLQGCHKILSICQNLREVVFNSCDFEADHPNHLHISPPRIDSLEELVITSNTSLNTVSWLLKTCPRVKTVHLGSSTSVSDQMFSELCQAGSLTLLEEIQVERSAQLSLETLNTLLCHCPSIRSVGDLANWGQVSGSELGQMRLIAHEQNLALDLSSHQVLRRFLGLAGEDRRHLVTMMTGPVLERIRLAQQEEAARVEEE